MPDLQYPLVYGQALTDAERRTVWELLRQPFPDDWIEHKPQPIRRDGQKSRCADGANRGGDGHHCGQWHKLPAIHIAFVGHARINKRLTDIIGNNWQMSGYRLDPDRPALTVDQGVAHLTAELTILGETQRSVGSAAVGGEEWMKALEGDALRRAAMRHGIGLDMWIRGELVSNPTDIPDRPLFASAADIGRWVADHAAAADRPMLVEVIRAHCGLLEQQGRYRPGSLDRLVQQYCESKGLPAMTLDRLDNMAIAEFASVLFDTPIAVQTLAAV